MDELIADLWHELSHNRYESRMVFQKLGKADLALIYDAPRNTLTYSDGMFRVAYEIDWEYTEQAELVHLGRFLKALRPIHSVLNNYLKEKGE